MSKFSDYIQGTDGVVKIKDAVIAEGIQVLWFHTGATTIYKIVGYDPKHPEIVPVTVIKDFPSSPDDPKFSRGHGSLRKPADLKTFVVEYDVFNFHITMEDRDKSCVRELCLDYNAWPHVIEKHMIGQVIKFQSGWVTSGHNRVHQIAKAII